MNILYNLIKTLCEGLILQCIMHLHYTSLVYRGRSHGKRDIHQNHAIDTTFVYMG